jgi:hypothetical protein
VRQSPLVLRPQMDPLYHPLMIDGYRALVNDNWQGKLTHSLIIYLEGARKAIRSISQYTRFLAEISTPDPPNTRRACALDRDFRVQYLVTPVWDCVNNVLLFQVVRAASPVLLRVITLGAFFIYCTVSTVAINRIVSDTPEPHIWPNGQLLPCVTASCFFLAWLILATDYTALYHRKSLIYFLSKIHMRFSSLPWVLHVPPIPSPLILSP